MFDDFLDNENDVVFGDSAVSDVTDQPAESVILHNDGELTEEMQSESLIDSENFLIAPIDDLEPVTILVALIVVILLMQMIIRAFKGNT